MDKKIIRKIMAVLLCGSVLISSNGMSVLAQDKDELEYGKDYIYKDFTFRQDTHEGSGICITAYTGEKKELTIPKEINGLKVVEINIEESGIFSKTVKKVNLPETGQIEAVNFRGCTKLESVNIPEGVKYIGDDAFEGCTSLKSIHIPSTVKYIYQEAFQDSGVEKVTISEGVSSIGQYAFFCCSRLKSITLPGSLSYIGMLAFSGTKLKKVIIKKCDGIGEGAFEGCEYLEYVKLPAGLKNIWQGAFSKCSRLKKITIPKSTIYMENPVSKSTKLFFESPYMKKYAGRKKDVIGRWHSINTYIKGVEIKVKGRYCYGETKSILNKINQKRKAKKLGKISLSYAGLNSAMERAVYSGIVSMDWSEKPNKTPCKYELTGENKVEGRYENGRLKTREQFINEIMSNEGFERIKTIGIGCVKINKKYYYFAVADAKKGGNKVIKKLYKDKNFEKNIAVRGDYIKKIAGKNTTLRRGKKLKISIKARLTEKSPYNMKKYSEGRITLNNLKITSSNKNVVKVDKKGVITGVKRGTAKLKVCLKMNKKRSTVVKVKVV